MVDQLTSATVVVTVANAPYLAAAMALGDSVAKHCPGVRFIIGLIDRLPTEMDVEYETLSLEQLFPDGFQDLVLRSGVFGVAVAGKAAALQAVFGSFPDVELAIYVDSDSWATGDFVSVARRHSGNILLTPHSIETAPGFEVANRLLRYGQFNAGFIAVRRSDEANRFLEWWGRMIASECSSGVLVSSYVDQGYLDLVPLAFPSTQIIKDPGVNAGYWTPGFEQLCRRGGSWFLSDERIVSLFHFSGFSASEPDRLTKFLPRSIGAQSAELRELLGSYGTALSARSTSGQLKGWLQEEAERIAYQDRRALGLFSRAFRQIGVLLNRIGWKLILRHWARSRN